MHGEQCNGKGSLSVQEEIEKKPKCERRTPIENYTIHSKRIAVLMTYKNVESSVRMMRWRSKK